MNIHRYLNEFDFSFQEQRNYRNDLNLSDRQAWANSIDPDRLIRVYTVCHSVCIFWTHNSMENPYWSKFWIIRVNFPGVHIFRSFTVFLPEGASGTLKSPGAAGAGDLAPRKITKQCKYIKLMHIISTSYLAYIYFAFVFVSVFSTKT